jgi:hypothetical protein
MHCFSGAAMLYAAPLSLKIRKCCKYVLVKLKSEVIPVTGRVGPWVYETSRLPHFLDVLDNWLAEGGEVASLPALRAGSPAPTALRIFIGTDGTGLYSFLYVSFSGGVDPRAVMRLTSLGRLKNPMTNQLHYH